MRPRASAPSGATERRAEGAGPLEELYGVSVDLPCWLHASIDSAQVDPLQLIDDPDDDEGHAKVERIRAAAARGERMPPVIVIHQPSESVYRYYLIEGRHRYNGAVADQLHLVAWVAHIDCCGGPAADLRE